jgi:quercetin dioxygenase-like cupin family protein
MAGYTVVNLREVEDSGARFGFAPHMQARFARGALELEKSGLSLFTLAPGYRMPFGHRHSEQEEIYVVLSGSARFKLEDAVEELGPLDALRVPGSTARGIEAGPDGAELIAFGAPFTGNKDAEPVPGFWED